jgi:hypothetical protein
MQVYSSSNLPGHGHGHEHEYEKEKVKIYKIVKKIKYFTYVRLHHRKTDFWHILEYGQRDYCAEFCQSVEALRILWGQSCVPLGYISAIALPCDTPVDEVLVINVPLGDFH